MNDRFKANEYRNLAFYKIVGITRDFLPPEYYNNILCFLVFLRILCKDKIDKKDILDAEFMINLFCKLFEDLYGMESCTFNLHRHLHLPKQVEQYGPLNKISCMAFEGMFKYFKKFLNGTRGLPSHIANGVELDRFIHFYAPELTSKSDNYLLKSFIKNKIFNQNEPKNF